MIVRPPLRRPVTGRVVAGVAQGLAGHLLVPTPAVRIAFVLLSVFGGSGLFAYLALWAVLPQDDHGARDAAATVDAGAALGRPARSGEARRLLESLRADNERLQWLVIGVGMIAAAGLLAASRLEIGLNRVALPVAVVLAGATLGLSQLDRAERDRWLAQATLDRPGGVLRVAGGLLLVIAGMVLAVVPSLDPSDLALVAVSAVAVLGGVALVLAPWALRLWHDLEAERRLRERASERAEIAAHLHDSVLQTLALIQRRSADADQVARLARSQERQLREYLYGAQPRDDEHETAATAVRRICGTIEDDEGIPIDVVVVGDRPSDTATGVVLQSLREAVLNAARHGRVGVSVFVECGPGSIEAFVRDRGPGFNLDQVPTDRFGVRESVIGRMERAGGSATVRRAPGGGTEVSLALTEVPAPTGGPGAA